MLGPDLYLEVARRLGLALLAGAAIGFERSYHGRPAGFRTHALVSLASALLMLITVYQSQWFTPADGARTTLDPTRMAQGIMTGIGFLGAGAILKASTGIRGLTTAASIWTTAALGVMIGAGLFFPAALAAVLALGTLSTFRWIERAMPVQTYAALSVRFPAEALMPEAALRALVKQHGFSMTNLSYRLSAVDGMFEYAMTLRTSRAQNMVRFAETLSQSSAIRDFTLAPIGA